MTEDEIAIREIVKNMERAWDASDSHGFAAAFVEDANFIHIFGGQLDGRPAIEASHRAIFDTIYRNSVLRFEVRSVRFLHPDVAIAFAQGNITFRDAADKREINARPTLILLKRDGVWCIVALQNTRVSDLPAAVQIPESPSTN